MNVKAVENPEDYREYLADKGLYEAYKNRSNIPTIDQLVRRWVEHEGRQSVIPTPSDNAKP